MTLTSVRRLGGLAVLRYRLQFPDQVESATKELLIPTSKNELRLGF